MTMLKTKKLTLEQYLQPFSISAFAISEDESFLIYSSNSNGNYNLWKLELNGSAAPQQLTFHNQKTEAISISSNPMTKETSIFFTSDKDGNENSHLYSVNQNGGNWQDIRTEPQSRYFLGGVSQDGLRLFYTSTKDNPLYLSIFSYDIKSGLEKLLHEGQEAETHLLGMSPNEAEFAYFARTNHSNMKIYGTSNGCAVELVPDAKQEYRVSSLSYISEDIVYFGTNYGHEFTYLAKYDFHTGEFEKVLEILREDIESIKYCSTSGELYIKTKKGPVDRLYSYHLKNHALNDLNLPTDTIQDFLITDSCSVYICGSSARKPVTIFQKQKDKEWLPLLENQVETISEEELVKPELITYPSFDGVEIEAMYYSAKKENSNGHVIVYPHGGPQYNEQIFYDGFFQYLLQEGFSIFAPNFRGTPNYGTSFLKMIEGDWGGAPRLDILAGVEMLAENRGVDSGKFILFGGSYGGYMSLLLSGRHPEKFKACVDICGPTSLFTLIETCPPHWKNRMDSWIGNPVRDRDRLIEQSPMTYFENITKPLLIIQGANDPRVKQSESEQIVAALRSKNIPVDYLLFPDEGHGFNKKENELTAFKHTVRFLKSIVE